MDKNPADVLFLSRSVAEVYLLLIPSTAINKAGKSLSVRRVWLGVPYSGVGRVQIGFLLLLLLSFLEREGEEGRRRNGRPTVRVDNK